MRSTLGRIKREVASGVGNLIVRAPLPLDAQAGAIRQLLPIDPWPKSLLYQQCLADRVIARDGALTQAGPFRGMKCLRDASEGCLVPKLLGSYEEEIVPAFESLFEAGFDRFIDVGCASGYWLTGAAMRMPQALCFGFDGDADALARCRELLELNRVDSRVKLFGLCDPADLQRLIVGRVLILMDIDGPEYEVLDPARAPALRQATIVVECHDYLDPRITPALLERFGGSHSIETITSRSRTPSVERYPGLRALPETHWAEALAERRPAVQHWLIMRPKAFDAAR